LQAACGPVNPHPSVGVDAVVGRCQQGEKP
jgi:hypothetical protein